MTPARQRRLLDSLEREYGPRIRRAFEGAFAEVRRRVNEADLVRAVQAGNIAAAVEAVGVTGPALRLFEQEIERAFEEAGRRFMGLFPKRGVRGPNGLQVQFAFDIRNPEAERWLADNAAGLVTRVVEDQREAIRAFLTEDLSRGVNPRTAALRLVGRINRATGRREGGIIGLSGPQSRYLRNAGDYLDAGDGRYFDLTLRDKRLDGPIRRAMESGSVPASLRNRALTAYSNRLLRHRGETIAQTETLNALRAAKHEAFSQGAQQAGVDDDLVTRVWDATGDGRTRLSHVFADGQEIVGRDAVFRVGGYPMRYPGDSRDAPASETVRCRCIEITRIDFIEAQARRERRL